jgi:AraC-like DNA-binding protein
MDVSLACEAIHMAPGVLFYADVVEEAGGTAAIAPFVHFHPQVELVWFRRVTGHVQIDGATFPLAPGQAVFLPSMQVHAFVTGKDERHWVLLQFEPFLVEAILRQPVCRVLADPCITCPPPDVAARIDMLCDWLMAISGSPAHGIEAQRVLELILILVAESAQREGQPVNLHKGSHNRLQPAIAMVHADPRRAPGLTEAAQACNVTGSYFSRLFKAQMGMGYAAYVQMHRMNLAARRLLGSDEPVAQIAYAVGFSSPAHFSTIFVERFGVSPREYRRLVSLQRRPVQKTESEWQDV